MPELPEVETSRRGLSPHVLGERISRVVVRQPRLRWPVPDSLTQIEGEVIQQVRRRAKYLLFDTNAGSCIMHLGMSGSVRILPEDVPPGKHDHVDIIFTNGKLLRLNDPRRFGAVLWTELPVESHPLLVKLGPEPLSAEFDQQRLFNRSRGRRITVKQLIMDSHVVVGVGNIYANEALFRAGVLPNRLSGEVEALEYQRLTDEIKVVLAEAIEQGGTTLRDFSQADGKPGYFQQKLCVYGRDHQACDRCGALIQAMRIGQRSTFYCPNCQK